MKNKYQSSLFGAHISIASGLNNAIEEGEKLGCTAIQIFISSNRQWHMASLKEQTIELFKASRLKSSVRIVIAHASYLINIGSPKDSVYKQSIKALSEELLRCQILDIPYLVVHPGSHLQTSEEKSLERVINALDTILQSAPGTTEIVLETMAGQGSTLCYTFDHLEYIIKNMHHIGRIGVCFDTCHVFAAGYDLRTEESYTKTWNIFNQKVGLKNLKVIHVNDSKAPLGAKIDRHEHLGMGTIGPKAFKLLFTDDRFLHIPKIIETPQKEPDDLKKNINFIKQIIKNEQSNR
jgi:deoxyribonuclease-4